MKISRKNLQLSLISLAIILIFFTYIYIPKITEKKFQDDFDEKAEVYKSDDTAENLFENVTYQGMYQLNNPFIISADKAKILEDDSNLVYMDKMLVTITLNSGGTITITADKGRYDKVNYDIFFENNVKAIDSDSGVTLLADNLDLLSNESATVYNNVILKDGKESYMQADLIKYDFNTKFYKVSMFGIYEKIKAKLINWINEEQKI